jgi:diguanylate cyclase (GGDEF)-like protein
MPDVLRFRPAEPSCFDFLAAASGSTRCAIGRECSGESTRHAYEMELLAYRDALTGLRNRRAYDDRFFELQDTEASAVMLLTVDVDRFKSINDRFGHDVGDATLVVVADAMLNSVRPGDFVARYGGDEFNILLPNASPEQALTIAERIRAAVEHNHDPDVTVSVGVTPMLDGVRETALAADGALYDAKKNGRNRVVVAH